MKKPFYLFLIFFSLNSIFICAQNTAKISEAESLIDRKLEEQRVNPPGDPKQKEEIYLRIKSEAEKLGYNWGIIHSGCELMRLYVDQGEYKKVVEMGNKIKKLLPDKKHFVSISVPVEVYRLNALSLGYLGFDEASLKDFKTAIGLAETIKNKDGKMYLLALCYDNLTIFYENNQSGNKKYKDSIKYYLNKSLEAAKQIKDGNGVVPDNFKYNQIAVNYMNLGILCLGEPNNRQESLKLAEKYLFEALRIYENYKLGISGGTNKTSLMNQLSLLYVEKKEYRKAIDYAERGLQLEKQFKNPYNRVESFEFLAESYLEVGEKEKSKFYMNEYTYLKDSLRVVEKNSVDTPLNQIVSDVKKDHEEETRKQLILIEILVFLGAVITFILWRRKSKMVHKKYKELIAKIITGKEEKETVPDDLPEKSEAQGVNTQGINITNETVKTILIKLKKFETSEKYLKKDVNLSWLANHLGTNPRYLSEIIKNHKERSFTNYINGLRVNYIINKLYDHQVYREYKINYLAEECGYASPRVFLAAFKKETGLTPSYFIEQLKASKKPSV